MDILHEEKVGPLTVKVVVDTDCGEGPREWDNLGTMACWHRRYTLGDKDGSKGMTPSEFQEFLREKKAIYLPLTLLDHSGLWMSTSKFLEDPQGWDSGQVGWIYVLPEKVREEYKVTEITPEIREKVVAMLEQEVKVYSAWLEGDVTGFIVEDEEGEHLDSCWGFIGDQDYCLAQGKESAEHILQARSEAEKFARSTFAE